MKTVSYVALVTLICIVIFWVFMALRPASAQASYFGPGPAGDGFPHPNYNRGANPAFLACVRDKTRHQGKMEHFALMALAARAGQACRRYR
jgi:hypothetical protein